MKMKHLHANFFWVAMVASLLILLGRSISNSMDNKIGPCQPESFQTIDSLYDALKLPVKCGKKLGGEGKTVLVKGWIDYQNIFDKSHYPNLPYEKFTISNDARSKTLEVWVTSERSDLIFKKIFNQKTIDPDIPVCIRGVLVGFDMPIMGACHRGIKIEIAEDKALTFGLCGAAPDSKRK